MGVGRGGGERDQNNVKVERANVCPPFIILILVGWAQPWPSPMG